MHSRPLPQDATSLANRQCHPSRSRHAVGCRKSHGEVAGRRLLSAKRQEEHSTSHKAADPWHPLQSPLIWQGNEEAALSSTELPARLTPAWKVLLLSDGSVTRHLQLLTGKPVVVDCLQMEHIEDGNGSVECLPSGARLIKAPLLQRQVVLRTQGEESTAYVYAASWWNADTVSTYLRNTQKPIWVNLAQNRTELYRDIHRVYHGDCPQLEQLLQCGGPFWGREYLFWHNSQPLTCIYEVFSGALEGMLGPAMADDMPNKYSC